MLYSVIMAGGSGTRFWPESRRNRPKQLLVIEKDKTMIKTTLDRVAPVIPLERIMVVTGANHAAEVRTQLPGLDPFMLVEETQRPQYSALRRPCRV